MNHPYGYLALTAICAGATGVSAHGNLFGVIVGLVGTGCCLILAYHHAREP